MSRLLSALSVVSLFVRLWVEISVHCHPLQENCRQPLREAVSWNNFFWCRNTVRRKSASSWGCELKYQVFRPLLFLTGSASSWGCELKSFRANSFPSVGQSASSWGCELKWHGCYFGFLVVVVSLFVRLWVEMCSSCNNSGLSKSASSWGCELKLSNRKYWHKMGNCQPLREAVSWNYGISLYTIYAFCQPLREAVSWNFERFRFVFKSSSVSLFVRLWVEIQMKILETPSTASASSWGCELKFAGLLFCTATPIVSLFVRLWVEI